jgi:crotonobetainyl-CoA:carnitine CoA-transferase CaiB-like acyl-CoA transferase
MIEAKNMSSQSFSNASDPDTVQGQGQNGAGPLSHVRVLDLTRIMAGPWSTQILADMGADVIKIERDGVGDDTRRWGPPYLKTPEGEATRESGYYLCVNRGKRSVAADLSTPEGQELVRALAATADIVVENFKVGDLARYGLAYDDLKAINPKLIYCSITGFGQTGPMRDQPAYDFMIQAMGGLMSVTGGADGTPGGGPQKVGVPIVDLMTGMYATVAILGALAHRAETGVGNYIDIAMLDVQVGFLANQAANYLVSGKAPVRTGNSHPNIQPQNVYPCADGYIALVVGNDNQFERLCKIIGCEELVGDPRFSSNSSRVENVAELTDLVGEAFSRQTRAEWFPLLEAAGLPSAPINTIPQVLELEQVVERGMVTKLRHVSGSDVTLVGTPLRFSETPLAAPKMPPCLGEHTKEVLAELGLDMA